MNAAAAVSPLARAEMAPRDPILGLNEAFQADPNPNKINLGIGVYTDDAGKVPLLKCIQQAEKELADKAAPRSYLPIDGIAAYSKAAQSLIFGADSEVVSSGRAVTVQALGGTGALKVGADFLKSLIPTAQALISDPSWENHRALFEQAGFAVSAYPYYDSAKRGVNFEGMKASLAAAPHGSLVILHSCCHNPTGYDLTQAQWNEIIAIVRDKGHVPFLDLAYQGFGDGIEADAWVPRAFAATPGPILLSSSFSKSFSLYGERIGALTVVAENKDEAARVLSQLKRTIRTNYSNPPTHGGQMVAMALTTPALRAMWEDELAQIRNRIKTMREQLVSKLKVLAPQADFSFMTAQRGMFSYSGLSKPQVERLRSEFGIYALDTGRICVASLNSRNIDYVTNAIAKVL
jgi:aromatic-amino-acid transaminase